MVGVGEEEEEEEREQEEEVEEERVGARPTVVRVGDGEDKLERGDDEEDEEEDTGEAVGEKGSWCTVESARASAPHASDDGKGVSRGAEKREEEGGALCKESLSSVASLYGAAGWLYGRGLQGASTCEA